MTWVEGNKYCGFYKNGKKNGFGIYYSPKGKLYIGFWKNGKQDGYGKYISKSKIKYGIFNNGNLEKKYENENIFYKDLLDINVNKNIIKTNWIFKWDINKIKNFLEIEN